MEKSFGGNKKVSTFAVPKKGWFKKKAKKDLWKNEATARRSLFWEGIYEQVKVPAKQLDYETLIFFFWEIKVSESNFIYNGEFDPGSGWTLAAGLIHASRGAAWVAILDGDRQTGAEHVQNLPSSGE